MRERSWHVDEVTAARYAAAATDPATAASIDTHVITCAQCQATVGQAADSDLLAYIWGGIDDTLDQPRVGWIEGRVQAMGLSDTTGRIVGATTRAHLSFLFVVVLSVGLAVLSSLSAGDADSAFAVFLLVAPLGPLAATASAFGRWSDPAFALTRTLPFSTWRIILVRTIAAIIPAIALTALSMPWLVDRGWMAAAWLLPSLALASAVLALSSWVEIELATIGVGLVWAAVPLAVHLGGAGIIDAFAGPLQPVSAAALVCAATITLARHTHFEYRRS